MRGFSKFPSNYSMSAVEGTAMPNEGEKYIYVGTITDEIYVQGTDDLGGTTEYAVPVRIDFGYVKQTGPVACYEMYRHARMIFHVRRARGWTKVNLDEWKQGGSIAERIRKQAWDITQQSMYWRNLREKRNIRKPMGIRADAY